MAEETAEQATETPQTEAPSAPEPQTEGSSSPDVSEQVQLLQQRLEKLETPADEPAPEIDGASLADSLLGVDADEDYEDTFDYGEEADGQEEEVHPIVQEIEQIKGYLANREHQDRLGELNSLVNEYPELAETATQEKIAGALGPLADRYGDAVLVEPTLIKQALLAIKAEAVSASEKPAEEARNSGASLESEAGARADSDEQDDNAAAAREIVESGPAKSVFG